MASQTQFLFLADLDPRLRFEAFERMCYLREIKPTTADSYWSTWLGIQRALGVEPSEADWRVTKLLKSRAATCPVNFPTPATMADIERFGTLFRKSHPAITAVV